MPTFETQGGTNPGVTILNADGTVHTAHTTAGFTEAVIGSGVYNFAHPAHGTLLEFIFDATVGGSTLYASVWDDGTTLATVDGKADTLLADVAATLKAADYPVPASWAAITDATVADDGSGALGPVKVEGVLTAGVLVEALLGSAVKNSTVTDGDGEFSLPVPHGATYSVRFSYDGHVSEAKEVTVA